MSNAAQPYGDQPLPPRPEDRRPRPKSAASPSPRERFEASHDPQDFLRWLNAYTNQGRADDELHALCSWGHSVIAELQNEAQRLRKLVATAVSGIPSDA